MSSLKHVICSRRRVLSSSGWYISTTSPIFASGWSFGCSTRSSANIENIKLMCDCHSFCIEVVAIEYIPLKFFWCVYNLNNFILMDCLLRWLVDWAIFLHCASADVELRHFTKFRPKFNSRRFHAQPILLIPKIPQTESKICEIISQFHFMRRVFFSFFQFYYLSFTFNVFPCNATLLWVNSRNCQNRDTDIWQCHIVTVTLV